MGFRAPGSLKGGFVGSGSELARGRSSAGDVKSGRGDLLSGRGGLGGPETWCPQRQDGKKAKKSGYLIRGVTEVA